MAEYIKREDAIELFWPVDPENDGSDGCTVGLKCGHYNSNEIETMLSDLPAAEVAEVRHGRWEYIAGTANTYSRLRCNCCGWWTLDPSVNSVYHFCPNCGTRMDKEDEHEAD